MSDRFVELTRELATYHISAEELFLHGLLTGCATIPALDQEGLFLEISPRQPLAESVRDAVLDVVTGLSEELSRDAFRARFDIAQDKEFERWISGYLKAVEIHEHQWQEENELHMTAGAALIMLHGLVNEKLRRGVDMGLPAPGDLQDDPELVSKLVLDIYHDFHDEMDDKLKDMDEEELFALVIACNDELPLGVVQECAKRTDAMVPVLRRHLEDEANWADDVDEGNRWALLHSVHILGLIPGKASAEALLVAFSRINLDENSDLPDWLSSCWPALCQNKTEHTTAPLRKIAEYRALNWYARGQAVDCVLAEAYATGSAELEQAIDWLAAMCGDDTEDEEFRVIAGHNLLDFPRERHRPIMEALVALQEPDSLVANAFTLEDIDAGFDKGDDPEWLRVGDPWRFYHPDEIQRRQERWLEEDLQIDYTKIGRNEPCPCGSGKKYKKCCINR
jgi:hypothetical protein